MHAPSQQQNADKFPGQVPGSASAQGSTVAQRIAHIDDDPDIRDTVRRILEANEYAVESYQTMNDFMVSLWNSTNPPDLAIRLKSRGSATAPWAH